MFKTIRGRLTYANVMVTLLAFIVLGSGTALASYVVSSNSQVGPGTISGHGAPPGDHANVITHSINGNDLSANSVNSGAIQNGQVGPLDLNVNATRGTARYNDGPANVFCSVQPPPSPCAPAPDLVRMSLPKGSYLISAKTWLEGMGGSAHEGVCTLTAGADSDRTKVYLGPNGDTGSEQSVSLNVAHTFDPTGGNVVMRCDAGSNFISPDVAHDTKVSAVRVSYLQNISYP
jgi:hypothetical protein